MHFYVPQILEFMADTTKVQLDELLSFIVGYLEEQK